MELLLLRQEVHLSRQLDTTAAMAATLTALAHTVTQLKDAVVTKQTLHQTLQTECESPWSVVGENCLLLALGHKMSWAAARQYCSARGGDLVVFPDANTFAEILSYINSVNTENLAVGAWVGGGDEEVEGVWRWITGEAMPRGPPFWGSTNG
ncbi:hypothetical protein Pcinc_008645 [Petrolisthes cinctipes]|uniref:C-type lectin domain-containing protein n=1 Tax=Petrolisthes cinctipes TaxID=88211 RepID=A0AAE1G690_PETCI|nr:hypothetical protein Pcinc_008645 [Petrolisthes cinctipes]